MNMLLVMLLTASGLTRFHVRHRRRERRLEQRNVLSSEIDTRGEL
jgi:hypothetical protein